MKKVITVILACLAISSLFLPFEEFENMWSSFDPSGHLTPDFIAHDSWGQNDIITGYELITPIFPVILVVIGNFILGFSDKNYGKVVSLALICFGFSFTLHLFRLIDVPVAYTPGSLFRPPVRIIGIGFYILLITGLLSFAYVLLKFRR